MYEDIKNPTILGSGAIEHKKEFNIAALGMTNHNASVSPNNRYGRLGGIMGSGPSFFIER
jgi:hypothetical protein